jgi:hypothetical protein
MVVKAERTVASLKLLKLDPSITLPTSSLTRTSISGLASDSVR